MLHKMNEIYIKKFLDRKFPKQINYLSADDVYINIMCPRIDGRRLKGFSRWLFLSSRKPDIFMLFQRKVRLLALLFNKSTASFICWCLLKVNEFKLPKIAIIPFMTKGALCS